MFSQLSACPRRRLVICRARVVRPAINTRLTKRLATPCPSALARSRTSSHRRRSCLRFTRVSSIRWLRDVLLPLVSTCIRKLCCGSRASRPTRAASRGKVEMRRTATRSSRSLSISTSNASCTLMIPPKYSTTLMVSS